MSRGNAIQTRRPRSRAADGTISALAEAHETGVAFTDIADAVGFVIVVFAHFVIVDIAARSPGGAAACTACCAGAADGAALFQRLAFEVAGDMCGDLVAGAGCGDALEAGESGDAICALGF